MRYLLSLLLLVSTAFADEAAVKALAPTLWLKSYKGLTVTALKGVSAWANQGSVAAGFTQATAGNQPLVSRGDNRENRFTYSDDLSNAAWTKTNVTANSALLGTFTAQNGSIARAISTLAGQSYRFTIKARAVTGNTALTLMHTDSATGNTTAITVTAALADYTVTVLGKAAGGNVTFGLQDTNAAGFGQVEVTQWSVASSLADSTYQATTTYPEYRGSCNTAGNHCLPVVRFDGVDDAMTSTATLADIYANNAKTTYLVLRANAAAGTQNIFRDTGGYMQLYGSTADLTYKNFDTGADTIVKAFTVNTLSVVKAIHSGGNIDLSIDGVAAAPSVASGNTGDLSGTLFLGYATNDFNGSILELLAFNTALSPANQAVVEAYLASVMSASADPWKRVSVLP